MQQIANDVQQIVANSNDFAVPIIFVTPGGSVTKTIKGIAINHAFGFDPMSGAHVKTQTARVTVTEATLKNAGYPTRNAQDQVDLEGHLVTWVDVNGYTGNYTISRVFPGKTVGIIVCELTYYKTGGSLKKIIGWKGCAIQIEVVDTPDPTRTQTLGNGDVIPIEYAANGDKTLTIPELVSVAGITVLTPFVFNNQSVDTVTYDNAAKFTKSDGGFYTGNMISINASLPVYLV